ncbi:MAG: MbtH family protein [Gilvibacter sp.]
MADNTIYSVVINHEEQYSFWPTNKEVPKGWRAAGKNGTKDQCLAYIREVWAGNRPISLRHLMND